MQGLHQAADTLAVAYDKVRHLLPAVECSPAEPAEAFEVFAAVPVVRVAAPGVDEALLFVRFAAELGCLEAALVRFEPAEAFGLFVDKAAEFVHFVALRVGFVLMAGFFLKQF